MLEEVCAGIKKLLFFILTILLAVLAGAAVCLRLSAEWMLKTWNGLTVDELMYHLQVPLEGTNEGIITEYINTCAAPTILVLLLLLALAAAWKGEKRRAFFALMIAGSLIVGGSAFLKVWKTLDIGNYVDDQSVESDFIKDYYVDPKEVEITFPEEKRNLIYIFLESVELTYLDMENGGAFEENLMPELTVLAKENEDFSGESKKINGAYPLRGATWTMGAMFAQTSGLPLKISIEANSMDTQDAFFPSIKTIGDILQEEGYAQTLLIGSDATFGGRRLYFTEHGDYAMHDYNYAKEEERIAKDYKVFWGYEDQKLFEFAKEEILESAERGEPFNFTILTVDTHAEDGCVCEKCSDDYEEQYANVISCASRQVARFVEWIQRQDFYESTTIVLAGDHLTMDSDFCENVDPQYDRKVFVSYINPVAENAVKSAREYATLDMYPTTLAALGATIEGDRLGLGTNLFSNTPTLLERFGYTKVQEELGKKSEFMEQIAEIEE